MEGALIWPNEGDSGISISKSGYNSSVKRAFYEFNIGNLSFAPHTVITSAFFRVNARNIEASYKYFFVDISSYVGNGIPDLSDYQAGKWSLLTDLKFGAYPFYPIEADFTQFVNQLISNGDAFAGFGISPSSFTYSDGSASLDNSASLIIETVPEPTTIFGSALALGVGGWLKRKKSGQQNKTTSQH